MSLLSSVSMKEGGGGSESSSDDNDDMSTDGGGGGDGVVTINGDNVTLWTLEQSTSQSVAPPLILMVITWLVSSVSMISSSSGLSLCLLGGLTGAHDTGTGIVDIVDDVGDTFLSVDDAEHDVEQDFP